MVKNCVGLVWIIFFLHFSALSGQAKTAKGQNVNRSSLPETTQRNPAAIDVSYPFRCRIERLSTSSAVPNSPLEIQENGWVSTGKGGSYNAIRVLNVGPAPIVSLTLLVEYLDQEGTVLSRIANAAATNEVIDDFHPPIPVQHVEDWQTDLMPGEAAGFSGAAFGSRFIGCPNRSLVTAIFVQYRGGKSVVSVVPGWKIGPIPKFDPRESTFPLELVKAPTAISASLKIDSNGKVQEVLFADNQLGLAGLLKNWWMRGWTFFPGLQDGQPVASELFVSIRFHSTKILDFPPELEVADPAVLVDLYPGELARGGWDVYYGGMPGTVWFPQNR